jgi:hypothetical protein
MNQETDSERLNRIGEKVKLVYGQFIMEAAQPQQIDNQTLLEKCGGWFYQMFLEPDPKFGIRPWQAWLLFVFVLLPLLAITLIQDVFVSLFKRIS